jgi:hypothetical protein
MSERYWHNRNRIKSSVAFECARLDCTSDDHPATAKRPAQPGKREEHFGPQDPREHAIDARTEREFTFDGSICIV